MSELPSLRFLHDESLLVETKLNTFRDVTTEGLLDSLKPGQPGSLKVRPDGTMIDGHHRIRVLRERGVDVNSLPRETLLRD
jgi:ParB-like chromosome segregation protein Spo0J